MVRIITKELFDHLPSDIHRQIAIECFLKTGEWVIGDYFPDKTGKEEK